MVVTKVLMRPAPPPASVTQPPHTFDPAVSFAPEPSCSIDTHPNVAPPPRVLTSELANGGGRGVATRDEVVPLTAGQRRVDFKFGEQVLEKLEAARAAAPHLPRCRSRRSKSRSR